MLLSVLGQPFKCPPAPFEGAFLLHEQFTQRGIRDSVEMTTTFPMARPVPVTGEVSQMFRDRLAARDVKELPENLVTSIDPATRSAQLATARSCPTTCSSASPSTGRRPARGLGPHRQQLGPRRPVQPPDPFPRRLCARRCLYRPADRPEGGYLRRVGRARRRRRHRGDDHRRGAPAPYGGSGVCYAEFGDGLVSKVEVNFLDGDAPAAQRHDPSLVRRGEGRVRGSPTGALVRELDGEHCEEASGRQHALDSKRRHVTPR